VSALVIDTSSWIDYFGSGLRSEIIEDALKEGRVYLPPLVAAELSSGALGKKERASLESFLQDLPLCQTPFDHWVRVGRLRQKLLAAGETLSTPDAHVAQCALDLEGVLLSEDRLFSRIARVAGLRLVAK
jgi:tRNA(fMet)-specific endonuclease VapC